MNNAYGNVQFPYILPKISQIPAIYMYMYLEAVVVISGKENYKKKSYLGLEEDTFQM